MPSPPFHGSCLCGKVAFEVDAAPLMVSCCHCSNCKKYTGSVFTSGVVFPANTVRFTKGEEVTKTYAGAAEDSGNALERIFCSDCSTPLFAANCEFGKKISVSYSVLDDLNEPGKAEKQPEVEFYSKDRTSWARPLEGSLQPRTKPGRE